MKKKERVVSSLNGAVITDKRRDGNTTRIVDNAIRLLFLGETVLCEDHVQNKSKQRFNKIVFNRVIKRLSTEIFYGHAHELIEADMKTLKIKLKQSWQ